MLTQTELNEPSHACTRETCPADGRWFVASFTERTERVYYLVSGPYTTHAQARLDIDKVKSLALKHDPDAKNFSGWYAIHAEPLLPDGMIMQGILQRAGIYSLEKRKFSLRSVFRKASLQLTKGYVQ